MHAEPIDGALFSATRPDAANSALPFVTGDVHCDTVPRLQRATSTFDRVPCTTRWLHCMAMKHPSTPSAALRLVVADDHPVVLAGLVSLLSQEPDFSVVGQARDGSEAVSLWRELAPDAGVLDLSMPGLDGFAAIEAIRHADPDARLVVLTTMGGDEDVYRALQAGASGFLLKDCARFELAECLRRVSRGLKYLQPVAAARLAERVTFEALTLRESEVLQGLASGRSNRWIADTLGVAEGTVKTHVKSLLGKLEARSRTEAVAIGLRRGFVRSPSL